MTRTVGVIALIMITLFAAGCNDGKLGKLKAPEYSVSVKCYSGGVLIFEGRSSGKVSSDRHGDGYYFVDRRGKYPVEVSGDCVIEYDDK